MMQAEYHKLSQEQAKEWMDTHEQVLVVDVRRPEEYRLGRIKGAILLPLDQIGSRKPELLPDQNQELLIYCRSGIRSEQAARELVSLGYRKVYDFGGIITWPHEIEH